MAIERPKSVILGLDGKTPIHAHSKTVVKIEVIHKAGGPNTPIKRFPILHAEVDGDLHTIKGVLQQAFENLLALLIKLGVAKGQIPGNQPPA